MIRAILFLGCISAAWSFQPLTKIARTTALNIVAGDKEDVKDKVKKVFENAKKDVKFEGLIKENFSGALSNKDLATKVVELLEKKGFAAANTLLATSLCADELARRLEDDFVSIFGNNFNLGGLSGFPFAGNTGFGAMQVCVFVV